MMSGNPFADLLEAPAVSSNGIIGSVAVTGDSLTAAREAGVDEPPASPPQPSSEWACPVVVIIGTDAIEGADRVRIARFNGGESDRPWDYPVVVQSSTYSVGDWAVYIPVDSVIPDHPETSFLGRDLRRLRAKRIRGVYSEGLLVPFSDAAAMISRGVPDAVIPGMDDAVEKAEAVEKTLRQILEPGQDIAEMLGVVKWLPPTRSKMAGTAVRPGSKKAPDESVMPVYRVSNAKKGEGFHQLAKDTRVIVTEKLHGANIRFMLKKHEGPEGGASYEFHLGSHNTMRHSDNCYGPGPGQDWFQRCAGVYNLAETLEENDICDIAFYGEVLGVQDLTYGSSPELPSLRIFDAYAVSAERWYSWADIVELCRAAGLDHAPVLYDGPLEECPYKELAEGETVIGNVPHVREGVVIRTFAGGATHQGPLRKWKYVGQGYRTRKGDQTDNQE